MEVIAELVKPYTEEERTQFIFQYNRGANNYLIRETDEALQALDRTSEEKAALRQHDFNLAFFKTSLGNIRRKVSMKDGSKKDFLSDVLLQIKAGLEAGQTIQIITYKDPDFTHELTDEYMLSLQEKKTPNAQFIQECLQQTVKDFYGEEEE